MADPAKLIVRAAERGPELSFSHPLNPKSDIHGWLFGTATGLQRVGVNLIRIPPGKESFVYHRHFSEEEWCYILSGRAIVELDEESHPVTAGDFVAFPPGVAHHLRNDGEEDLVYLSGGERRQREIADFPRHGKRMIRDGQKSAIYPLAAGEPFPGTEKL